jgi:ketosteroid isomerase-like protein
MKPLAPVMNTRAIAARGYRWAMGDDNVGLVRRAYESWNRDGFAAIESLLATDIELHDAPELPDAEIWRGKEAVIARIEAVAASVGSGSGEVQSVRNTDEDVLVTVLWQLERETGGTDDLGQVFHLVQVTDGRISRIRVFLTEADALRA